MEENWKQFVTKSRRLSLLRFLKECGGQANDSIIQNVLENTYGFSKSPRETYRQDIRFCEDNGLVVISWAGEVMVAQITKRGVEVAEGRTAVEGIQPPSVGV